MYFVIRYDREAGRLIELVPFETDERSEASKFRIDLELELLTKQIENEVVVLEADSIDALSITHNRYFRNVLELADIVRHRSSHSRRPGPGNAQGG